MTFLGGKTPLWFATFEKRSPNIVPPNRTDSIYRVQYRYSWVQFYAVPTYSILVWSLVRFSIVQYQKGKQYSMDQYSTVQYQWGLQEV